MNIKILADPEDVVFAEGGSNFMIEWFANNLKKKKKKKDIVLKDFLKQGYLVSILSSMYKILLSVYQRNLLFVN